MDRKPDKYLYVGGVIAIGFDTTGDYMLVVSHSGRGVFSTETWERLARDPELSFPENNISIGIGPIDKESVPVTEIDYDTGVLNTSSLDGKIILRYEEGTIKIFHLEL